MWVALDAAERGELPLHWPSCRCGVLRRARVVRLPDSLDGDVDSRADVARVVDLRRGAPAEDAAELVPALKDLRVARAAHMVDASQLFGGMSQ